MMAEVEKQVERLLNSKDFVVIGKGIARVDSLEAVTGRLAFTGDLLPSNVLYVRPVRSTVPHALIKDIDFSAAKNIPGIVGIYTWRDIPGINDAGSLIPDRPFLAVDKVRHYGEAMAIIAGERPEAVDEAIGLVRVEYERLPAVFDPVEAMKPDAPKVHDKGNICRHMKIRKGDVEKGFQEADVIIENTYQTEFIDSVPPEPEIGLASPDQDGGITCIGSMQNPFDVRWKVADILGLPQEKVRVIQAATGGGFGPKSDETPIDVCAYAALVAYKTGRSAVSIMTRDEAMVTQAKRHKFIIKNKTGARSDGRLVAWESTLIEDTGAYISKGHLVIVRAIFHCAGPYDIPNVKADGYCVLTNNTFAGSTRGFGAPQAFFAAERQMDELARKLGIDPFELRLKNLLRRGSKTITSAEIEDDGLAMCAEWVYNNSEWVRKRREYEEFNRKTRGPIRKGIGVAMIYHGNTLGPEGEDFAYVDVSVDKDGKVSVRTGLTDFGTGAATGLLMIVAEELGVTLDKVRMERPDTSKVQNPGPTVASRVTAIGGRAAQEAASKIREKLRGVAAEMLGCPSERVVFREGRVYDSENPENKVSFEEVVSQAYRIGLELKETGYYIAPPTKWDEETGQGKPYNQYTYGAEVAEVEVDVETGLVKVVRITCAFDVGRIVNPIGLKDVVHGGTIMGMGQAIMERFIHEDGIVLTDNFSTYWIPTAVDSPEIIYHLIESPGPAGAYGAKAMGEIPVVPPPAAISNAVAHALGVPVKQIPLTPDRVLELVKRAGET